MRKILPACFLPFVATVSILLLFAGCDTTLEPFSEETGLYSIYGYLTVGKETHHIRIKNLNDPVLSDTSATLDATVTLENLDSGTTKTLLDSLVRFGGISTHNFRAQQEIDPATRYRLTVERSDGRSARSTASTPKITVAEISPPEDAPCYDVVRIRFPEISERRLVRASIGVSYGGQTEWVPVELVGGRGDGRGVFYGFKPALAVEEVVPNDITPVVNCDPNKYCSLLDDRKIRVAYTHFGPDWPADSLITNPLESNVENGTGIFGGLRRDTLVTLTDTELRCPGSDTVPCTDVPVPPGEGGASCPDMGDL